ncbi:threonine-phosphate decarboxylase [Oculatella sp. LEGE 06141]|uniref:threonine-phosphate decarboxylase CobD n=1 Tax=Oculatella sp. LEGE 06141 TaxID=1828648 RepID=UPI00187FC39B|nr:threonine-phosphate decarboxylase CobD [Oculatella sp. LEGE 06141]MBE9180692.1 threonine-phosphate decarboxylase [Oculatella sp. LEGE 06141]
MSSTRPTHGGNLAWAAALSGCSPSDILDFSASINPLGPPQAAIATIHTHLNRLPHYPDPNYGDLRHALSQFHQVPMDWILPGNGSAELLTWAARELAELDAVYLLTPSFSDYRRALAAFSANVVAQPLPQFDASSEIGSEGADFSISAPFTSLRRQSVGLLLNNPHNPTGQLFSTSAILPYLEQFALVVVDEAFMDFLPPDQQQSLIDRVSDHPNLVVLRSLTKFYSLAGLRLGYAIAHPDRLQRWQQWRDPWSVNSLAAAAGAIVVQDTAFQHQTWTWVQQARSQLFAGLSAIPGLHPLPSAANFLLVQSQQSTTQLQHQLLKQRCILIRDCISFPELGDRYFRVAVRTEAENQQLLDGLAHCLVYPEPLG